MATDGTTDQTRYDALKRTVLTLGPIRRGSLARRFMPCGKPGCCCQASPPWAISGLTITQVTISSALVSFTHSQVSGAAYRNSARKEQEGVLIDLN